MLGRCLYGRTEHQDPLPIDDIKYLQLPWNEHGTHGRVTMIKACDEKYEDMKLFGDTIVQIQMTCSNMPHDSARLWRSSNKSKRVVTHIEACRILQKYFSQCGGKTVYITDDGFLSVI